MMYATENNLFDYAYKFYEVEGGGLYKFIFNYGWYLIAGKNKNHKT